MSARHAPEMALAEVARRLKIAGIEQAALEARILAAEALHCTPDRLHGAASVTLTAGERLHLDELIARRINREPIAYITGRREFWSMLFKVGPGVLIPRPDSETVVETVTREWRDRAAPLRILDLGTGSGCLLLALLREFPNAIGVGVDASAVAIETASENALELGLEGRARFIELDWCNRLDPLYTNLSGSRFDIVVSNPPYIAEDDMRELMRDVVDYEPHRALAGGADGLDAYRQILPLMNVCLDTRGLAVLECGAGQAAQIAILAKDQGFVEETCALDLAGVERCVTLRRDRQKNLLE